MYVVDTNVISETMKQRPDARAIAWLKSHGQDLYLPALAIEELSYGVLRLPHGKRKDAYASMVEALAESYADKILPYDTRAAWTCAAYRWQAHASGFHPSAQDMMIAAIAHTNGATLVTRNVKDFAFLNIALVNPFEDAEPSAPAVQL